MNGVIEQKTSFQNMFDIFLPMLLSMFGPICNNSVIFSSWPIIGFVNKHKILGQKALVLQALLNHENFKDAQKHFKSTIPKPPAFPESLASSLHTLSSLSFHKNLKIIFSRYLIFCCPSWVELGLDGLI